MGHIIVLHLLCVSGGEPSLLGLLRHRLCYSVRVPCYRFPTVFFSYKYTPLYGESNFFLSSSSQLMFPPCSIDPQLSFIPHMQWHLIIFYLLPTSFSVCLSTFPSIWTMCFMATNFRSQIFVGLECTYYNCSWRFLTLRNHNTVLLRPIVHVSDPNTYIYIRLKLPQHLWNAETT